MGKAMIKTTCKRELNLLRSIWISLMSFAVAKATATLANSAGCRLTPPKAYHERAPEIVLPKGYSPMSSKITQINDTGKAFKNFRGSYEYKQYCSNANNKEHQLFPNGAAQVEKFGLFSIKSRRIYIGDAKANQSDINKEETQSRRKLLFIDFKWFSETGFKYSSSRLPSSIRFSSHLLWLLQSSNFRSSGSQWVLPNALPNSHFQ